jgi:hypothetical protein
VVVAVSNSRRSRRVGKQQRQRKSKREGLDVESHKKAQRDVVPRAHMSLEVDKVHVLRKYGTVVGSEM